MKGIDDMGLFDFLKGKKKESKPAAPAEQEAEQQSIKYETKITARELKADPQTVKEIVNKMVDEDPFKTFYGGKTAEDFTPLTSRAYKFDNITTLNVDFVHKEKGRVLVNIEGIPLGFLTEEQALTVQKYQEKYLLTAYVYATGGPFLEYDKEKEDVVEGEAPYGLDIFIQFT